MDHFETICKDYFEGGWEKYKSFLPPGIPSLLTTDEYYRIPVFKGECMVIMMLWGPGARTAIHDHGGSRGTVKVLKGRLTEKRFRFDGSKLEQYSTTTGIPGDILSVSSTDLHSIENGEDEMSVSLHIYDTASNSFEGTVIYDAVNKRFGVLNGFASRASWREKPEAFSSITYFGQ